LASTFEAETSLGPVLKNWVHLGAISSLKVQAKKDSRVGFVPMISGWRPHQHSRRFTSVRFCMNVLPSISAKMFYEHLRDDIAATNGAEFRSDCYCGSAMGMKHSCTPMKHSCTPNAHLEPGS